MPFSGPITRRILLVMPKTVPRRLTRSRSELQLFFPRGRSASRQFRTLGFDVTNDIFAENAWYFRNSLVRANYNDLKNGIHETTEFLELFLRNLLLNENYPLRNRTLHICGTFRVLENVNIEDQKENILCCLELCSFISIRIPSPQTASPAWQREPRHQSPPSLGAPAIREWV